MIEIDTADYGTEIRVRNGDKACKFPMPDGLQYQGTGMRPALDLVNMINQALKQVQG